MVLVVVFLYSVSFRNYSIFGMQDTDIFVVATNICESIVWKAFSPTTINTGRGPGRLSRSSYPAVP